jgi:hypothetical protein
VPGRVDVLLLAQDPRDDVDRLARIATPAHADPVADVPIQDLRPRCLGRAAECDRRRPEHRLREVLLDARRDQPDVAIVRQDEAIRRIAARRVCGD